MNREAHERAGSLFIELLDLPAPQRSAILDERCAGDSQLRDAVEALFKHDQQSDGLDEDALQSGHQFRTPFDDELSIAIPERIGRYRIIRKIGVGGMGIVYEAEQDEPRRRVALKILRMHFGRADTIKRFRRESRLLAALQHPAITHIYDAGTVDLPGGPQPYFAMEFVEGVPIDHWARFEKRTIAERLAMVANICDALQHAHDRSIVHRDIKPGNVLIDRTGQPKILDFGIGRMTESDVQMATIQTEVGQLVGTIPYMSPEQVLGDSSKIGAASDVYSVGVLLYELLAERLPLDVRERSFPEAARIISEDEPSRLGTINHRFRGDIDTIVAKALDKDASRRYISAAELARDIRRFLGNQPILARPASTLYQIKKFATRNKWLVASLATVFATMLTATFISTKFAISEAEQRHVADREKRSAVRSAYRSALIAAQGGLRNYDAINARRILNGVADELKAGWEWRHLYSCLDSSDFVLEGHTDVVTSITFSPDNSTVLSASADGSMRIWDRNTHSLKSEIWSHDGAVLQANFTLDGTHIVSRGDDHQLRVWDSRSGELIRVIDVLDHVTPSDSQAEADSTATRPQAPNHNRTVPTGAMDISPDGQFVTANREPHSMGIWELANGRLIDEVALWRDGGSIGAARFWADGESLHILLGWTRGITLWTPTADHSSPPESQLPYFKGPIDSTPLSIAVNAPKKLIATGSRDKTAVLWDASTMTPVKQLRGHSGGVQSVAFNGAGTMLATASNDQTIRLWDTDSGELSASLMGHTDAAQSVEFSPDGALLASASADRTIRLWKLDSPLGFGGDRVYRAHADYAYDVVFDPSDPRGRRVASMDWSGSVNVWDASTGETLGTIKTVSNPKCFCLNRDGKWLAVGSSSKQIDVLDLATGQIRARLDAKRADTTSVAFSADSTRLVGCRSFKTATHQGAATVWNIASGEVVADFNDPAWYVVAQCPTGLRIGAFDGAKSRMIDADANRILYSFDGPPSAVYCLVFSPDGTRFVTGDDDGTVTIWNASNGRRIADLRGHTEKVYGVAYSPDSQRIASCSNDNTVRIWDAATFEELLELREHDHYVHGLAFSPDGSMLISASGDKTVRVWDTLPRRVRNTR